MRGAAMAAGGAAVYHAGKKSQARNDEATTQQADAQQQAYDAGVADAQPQAPVSGGMSEDSIKKLQELSQLHDSGVLTDEEFAAQKAKLLG
jgi:hypothetical protein